MANGFASEFSPENIRRLTAGQSELLEPEVERSRRRLTQTLAGTPQLFGSARSGGLGKIEAARIADLGRFSQNLSLQGLGAGREERLLSEAREFEAGPTSSFSRQLAQRGGQFSKTLAEQIEERQQRGRQFDVTSGQSERQLTDALSTSALNRQFFPTQFTGLNSDANPFAIVNHSSLIYC